AEVAEGSCHELSVPPEQVLDQASRHRLLGREVLVQAADADAGDLRHPVGGEAVRPLALQNASRRLQDRRHRGPSSRLHRAFSRIRVDHGAPENASGRACRRILRLSRRLTMILVAGAGPGGLTAALALIRAGFEVRIWERAPELRAVGGGLTLQVNAMRMLAALGVADAVRQRGAVLATGEIADHRGRTLQAIPLGSFAERFGQAGVAIDRGALNRTLATALPPETLELGRGVTHVEQTASGVQVRDQHGAALAVEALIGADGIHSAVRRAVFGAFEPRYAGYTCWRGVAQLSASDRVARTIERWGRGRRFGSVPIGDGRIYWFATANAPAGGRDGADPRAELLERFADFCPSVRAELEATDMDGILRNDIVDLKPLARWTQGRVALLGDAAH